MIIGVTGSEGKLGRATVTRLRAEGHDVVGFDLAGPAGAGFTRLDLADYGQVLTPSSESPHGIRGSMRSCTSPPSR